MFQQQQAIKLAHQVLPLPACLALLLAATSAWPDAAAVGELEAHGDVGSVRKAGSLTFDAAAKGYTVAGDGVEMWYATDASHFVWKRVSGDASFSAEIRWIATGGNGHRKACLLVRQSLDAD